jgi:ornithine cyclodeaminase/alanine dehydrogenase-like protein (mu-crystallin family)
MPAWTGPGDENYIGVKLVAVYPSNGQIGLPSIHGLYYLIDGHTGQPLATMDGARMTVWRTAAASALASTYLSRPDSSTRDNDWCRRTKSVHDSRSHGSSPNSRSLFVESQYP